ncbi:MAG: hypothetical protein GF355_18160 [Candidatus Eisenbacteria bacterium]|nr:hypothetical protein [Candidatus Eisenbacteria bacterium]
MDSWRAERKASRRKRSTRGRADRSRLHPITIGLIPALLAALGIMLPGDAAGLPRFALREGAACSKCHVNPTGGGLRTLYGQGTYTRYHLARETVRTESLRHDGQVTSSLRVGADFRFQVLVEQAEREGENTNETGYETTEASLYAGFEPARDLILYIRHDPETEGTEAYGMLKDLWGPVYLKMGNFSPDYGLRVDDPSVYTRGGVGRDQFLNIFPDSSRGGLIFEQDYRDAGGEIGYDGRWLRLSAAYLNGNRGGELLGAEKIGVIRAELHPALGPFNPHAGFSILRRGGDQMYGVFGGLKLGPLAALGELDFADSMIVGIDHPQAGPEALAMMMEGSLRILRGLELVGRFELWDPNTDVAGEGFKRITAGVEYFPLPGLEIRPLFRVHQEPNSARNPSVRNNHLVLQVHLWL